MSREDSLRVALQKLQMRYGRLDARCDRLADGLRIAMEKIDRIRTAAQRARDSHPSGCACERCDALDEILDATATR